MRQWFARFKKNFKDTKHRLNDWCSRHEAEFYEPVSNGNKNEVRLFTVAMLGMLFAILLAIVWAVVIILDNEFSLSVLISLEALIYGFVVNVYRGNILYTQRENETHDQWLVRAKKLGTGLAKIELLLFALAIINLFLAVIG